MKSGLGTGGGAGAGGACWRVALTAVLLIGCRDGLAVDGAPCGAVFLQQSERADSSGPQDRRVSLFRPSDTLLAELPGNDGDGRIRLFLATEPDYACLRWQGAGAAARGPSRPRPDPRLTRLVTIGSLATVALFEYALWWKNGKRTDFHLVSEGWFDRDTYAGGADKVSHFVGGYIGVKILPTGPSATRSRRREPPRPSS